MTVGAKNVEPAGVGQACLDPFQLDQTGPTIGTRHVCDLHRPVASHLARLVVADGLVLVVLDADRPVLLPVQIDLLTPLLVFEK